MPVGLSAHHTNLGRVSGIEAKQNVAKLSSLKFSILQMAQRQGQNFLNLHPQVRSMRLSFDKRSITKKLQGNEWR